MNILAKEELLLVKNQSSGKIMTHEYEIDILRRK